MTNGGILLRADGDHQIGMGHVYRMLRLSAALRARGHSVCVVTVAGSPGEDLFASHGLETTSVARRYDYSAVEAIVRHRAPALIVFDMLNVDSECYRIVRSAHACPLIAFDEMGPAAGIADVVINALSFVQGAPGAVCKTLFEGPSYTILAPEFAAAERRSRAARAEKIFIGFGGSDTRNLTPRALRMMEAVKRRLSLTVNLGPAYRADPSFEEALARSSHSVQLVRNLNSLAEMFCQADLAFCAGGIMLSELAAVGCPAAAIASEPHERATVGYWAARGTAADLGWEKDLDLAVAASKIVRLVDDTDALTRMQAAGPCLVDGHGLQRCVEIIEKQIAA